MLAVVVVAGGAQDTAPACSAPATATWAAPATRSQVPVPDGFPTGLPVPQPAAVAWTQVAEQPLVAGNPADEHGTVVHRRVGYQLAADGVHEAVGFYRAALPMSGWTLQAVLPLDPRRCHDQGAAAGRLLHIGGLGGWPVSVRLTHTGHGVVAEVSITEVDQTRLPTGLPRWYPALPPPPAGSRRHRIAVTTGPGGTSYAVEYRDDHLPVGQRARADALVGHYRTALPATGWTNLDERDRGQRPGRYGGVIQTRRVSLRFTGHQVTGLVLADETTTAAGQRLGTKLSIQVGTVGVWP